VEVLELNEKKGALTRKCTADQSYTATKLLWIPDRVPFHTYSRMAQNLICFALQVNVYVYGILTLLNLPALLNLNSKMYFKLSNIEIR